MVVGLFEDLDTGAIMQRFLKRHKDRIVGVLSGFDRVLFRGTLRSIEYQAGFDKFLGAQRVLYKIFPASPNAFPNASRSTLRPLPISKVGRWCICRPPRSPRK